MKYSIIISPNHKNSNAQQYALGFADAVLKSGHEIISVFFYGYAAKMAFIENDGWRKLAENKVQLIACSTLTEKFIEQNMKPLDYFHIAGLAQWIEAIEKSDKCIELV